MRLVQTRITGLTTLLGENAVSPHINYRTNDVISEYRS